MLNLTIYHMLSTHVSYSITFANVNGSMSEENINTTVNSERRFQPHVTHSCAGEMDEPEGEKIRKTFCYFFE